MLINVDYKSTLIVCSVYFSFNVCLNDSVALGQACEESHRTQNSGFIYTYIPLVTYYLTFLKK
jgi:hypothetical protein